MKKAIALALALTLLLCLAACGGGSGGGGEKGELDPNLASNRAYDGLVYGIPSTGNAQGIVYNKVVARQAGYSADEAERQADSSLKPLPTTPDAFIQFLQDIKDKTDAIPLYTNFAADWTMGAWDAYIGGGATADPDWMIITMPQTKDPSWCST